MGPTCAIKLSLLMETISALSGTAPLSMLWLEELELNKVESSTQYGKVRKLTAEQSTQLSPHFQLDPSEQLVPKRARDSSTPTWQPGQSAW